MKTVCVSRAFNTFTCSYVCPLSLLYQANGHAIQRIWSILNRQLFISHWSYVATAYQSYHSIRSSQPQQKVGLGETFQGPRPEALTSPSVYISEVGYSSTYMYDHESSNNKWAGMPYNTFFLNGPYVTYGRQTPKLCIPASAKNATTESHSVLLHLYRAHYPSRQATAPNPDGRLSLNLNLKFHHRSERHHRQRPHSQQCPSACSPPRG